MELTNQNVWKEIPCHTLSYILNQINNRSNDTFNGTTISVYVYITHSQEITNLPSIQLLVNLYLIGVDNPVLSFSGLHHFFILQGGGSFYTENITFHKILVSFYSLVTVSFNKCIFTGTLNLANVEGLYIGYIYNVTITNCLFHNNDAPSNLLNIYNVEISGCEFYQNKAQIDFVLIVFKQDHNLTISNCLFHNNDALSDFINIYNVFNVEISGCEFYQNKGQIDFVSIIFKQVYNLIISNCLFRNNDAQLALIWIDDAFNVKISGCEFYQNKGQEYLIETYLGYFFDMDNCSIDDKTQYFIREVPNLSQCLLSLTVCSLITHLEGTF